MSSAVVIRVKSSSLRTTSVFKVFDRSSLGCLTGLVDLLVLIEAAVEEDVSCGPLTGAGFDWDSCSETPRKTGFAE